VASDLLLSTTDPLIKRMKNTITKQGTMRRETLLKKRKNTISICKRFREGAVLNNRANQTTTLKLDNLPQTTATVSVGLTISVLIVGIRVGHTLNSSLI
jgi:hypothetical protein